MSAPGYTRGFRYFIIPRNSSRACSSFWMLGAAQNAALLTSSIIVSFWRTAWILIASLSTSAMSAVLPSSKQLAFSTKQRSISAMSLSKAVACLSLSTRLDISGAMVSARRCWVLASNLSNRSVCWSWWTTRRFLRTAMLSSGKSLMSSLSRRIPTS